LNRSENGARVCDPQQLRKSQGSWTYEPSWRFSFLRVTEPRSVAWKFGIESRVSAESEWPCSQIHIFFWKTNPGRCPIIPRAVERISTRFNGELDSDPYIEIEDYW